jgi:hypothetical protein
MLGVRKIGWNLRTQESRTSARKLRPGDKESPKAYTHLKSYETLYTCPRAPFYKETKGLLHSENTLESKKYFQCEHVHGCLLHPVICGANFIHLQACH